MTTVFLQLRTRAFQTARHSNVEVVAGDGCKIVGVGVVGIGNDVGEGGQPVIGINLQLVGEEIVVVLQHTLAGFGLHFGGRAGALHSGSGRSPHLHGGQRLVLLFGLVVHQFRELSQGLVLE